MYGEDRRLVGSLTESYKFKSNGLMKKAMSTNVDGRSYRLIAYYSFHFMMPNFT